MEGDGASCCEAAWPADCLPLDYEVQIHVIYYHDGALVTLSLAETLREVAGRVPEVAHQIALASRR